ncbi:MAG: hypothetical protein E6Z04_12000, partial [Cutibacterium avidum]|nr:hypothetical protein [Cutibacterium avidum]
RTAPSRNSRSYFLRFSGISILIVDASTLRGEPHLIEIFNTEFPNEGDIRWWIDTKRTSRPRYVITRPDFDYVVVVEQRPGYALLVTAYYAEQAHCRRKLQREHDAYWAKQEPPTQ